MKVLPFLLLGMILPTLGAGEAFSPDLPLQQLNHRSFTSAEGAPNDIVALAQTSDGVLWIGGGNGLTRFDGVRFMPYPGSSEEPLRSTNISTLAAAPDGGLWIGFHSGGASFLKGGHVRNYVAGDGFPEGTVHQFAWDRDGSLWACARGGLAHFDGKRWEKDPLGTKVYCRAVLVDRRGTLWVATVGEGALLARVAGEKRFREIERLEFRYDAGDLAEAPDGRIWAAGAQKLIRIDRPATLEGGVLVTVSGFANQTMGPLVFDGEGNLWAVPDIVAGKVLLRVPARELIREGEHPVLVTPEILSDADGLSGNVEDVLEDREGNVWLGTGMGLDRFSHSNVMRGPAPCNRPALAAGDAGALWLACPYAPAMTSELRDGAMVTQQKTPAFSVAYRDPAGEVWFGGLSSLGHVESGRVVLTPLPPHLSGTGVHALVRDRSGAMWVSVTAKGLFRYFDGEWSEYGDSVLPRRNPVVEVADDRGTLWFGYPNSRIARLQGGLVQAFDRTHGLEVGNVQSILARGEDVWVGGELGLAHLHQGRFVSIHSASGTAPFRGISGIVRARSGDLWLNGIGGIVRIPREEIARVNLDSAYPVRCEILNYLDGIPGTATQFSPQPSAIETSDGRVWFSMSGGVVSIDVMHLARNTLPPPVTIRSLTAGHRQFADSRGELKLPIHTTNLQIDYTAGSLTVPERVQFRYKLEGSDPDWQDAGTRREALYTNLGPGHYTFQVIASNNDGVWNTKGASVDFMIPPAFYQTRWFYALSALACVALLTGLYRVRVRQVAAQVRGRLEARLGERERIARELHDTLLQGMQGLIWRFQAAADRISPDQPARQLMEQSLDRADKLLEESRDRVRDLRPVARDVTDLPQALAAEGAQCAQLHPANFRVSVQGTPRALHPIVREEVLLIGREALGNAFQHSGAKDIEAEVTYDDAALHVRVRDDGRGISASVLQSGGTPGHYGLIGMRERARKLGGQLEIWSRPGAGTEIALRVPAHVAYRPSEAGLPRARSLLAIFGSSAEPH